MLCTVYMLYCICSHRYVIQYTFVILYMSPWICYNVSIYSVYVDIDMFYGTEMLCCICSHTYVIQYVYTLYMWP